jgi:Flp pilus assembly protein CpaB
MTWRRVLIVLAVLLVVAVVVSVVVLNTSSGHVIESCNQLAGQHKCKTK